MNVTFLSATQYSGGSSSVNFAQNNFAVVLFAFQAANSNATPPTYNGINFTYYGQVGTNQKVYLWYMVTPPNGSYTFVPNDNGGGCNVYAFYNVNPTFADVFRNDQQDLANGGIALTPTLNNGYLLFFQQANSGSGTITLTNGQANKLFMGFGATFTHTSPGASNSYNSTVSYSPSFPDYDGFGIALAPYVVTAVTAPAVLVVAGGGDSGGVGSVNTAGGGAGGYIFDTSYPLTAQTYNITVGLGGQGTTSPQNGSNSVFGSHTAIGGGAPATLGGSGGGGYYSNPTTVNGGAGTFGQGFAGGNGQTSSNGGGGGGGAAAVGAPASSSNHGGNSGDGIWNTISGAAVAYAGGGVGGGTNPGSVGIAGTPIDQSGMANTGSGGGGPNLFTGSYNGGSGIVVVAWPTAMFSGATVTGGGTLTTLGSSTIATFTSNGTLTLLPLPSNALMFAGD
jgi:hypothetical protein